MTVDRRSGGLVAVGGTLSCHYNNSCCHRWLRGWRVDDLRFSVSVWVHDISRCICVCVIIFANVFHVNLSNKRLLNLNLGIFISSFLTKYISKNACSKIDVKMSMHNIQSKVAMQYQQCALLQDPSAHCFVKTNKQIHSTQYDMLRLWQN